MEHRDGFAGLEQSAIIEIRPDTGRYVSKFIKDGVAETPLMNGAFWQVIWPDRSRECTFHRR